MLTEEEARGMRCCGPEGLSRTGACIAAECMAWRCEGRELIGPEYQRAPKGITGEDLVRLIDNKRYKWTPVGFCGLAGRPETK